MLKENAEKMQVGVILENNMLANDLFHLKINVPKIAEKCKPGQFVMIKVISGLEPLLRRPFSLHRFERETGIIEIIYQVVGKGTNILSQRKNGEELDILGPLGNGFSFRGEKRIGVVGGGLGIAPLLAVAEQANNQGKEVVAFLGARTEKYLFAREDFKAVAQTIVTTDDGSFGNKGPVSRPLERFLEKNTLDLILACGPIPMLRAIANIAEAKGIPAQLSLEQRMGCGVGACLGCAFPIKADTAEGYTYKRVCYEGPVFWAQDVLFSISEKVNK